MKTRQPSRPFVIAWAGLLSVAALTTQLAAAPMGTAFTYQGKLNAGANAANGVYDFSFTLYTASGGGQRH